jgi:quercetin dioxygenase-like cupin family protein
MLPVLKIDESAAAAPPEPENFIGRVRMQQLAREGGAKDVELLAVFFDAGARTRPHTHAEDQILSFIRGTGFVVFPGEDEQLVEQGSIVIVPAGLVHMHGATDAGPICHIAARPATQPTDWHPEVPDEWRRFTR